MSLADSLSRASAIIAETREFVQIKEEVRDVLLPPFLEALGYDIFNNDEIQFNFTSDAAEGEVDYAIIRDESPVVLIECQSPEEELKLENTTELFRRCSKAGAFLAILTNGIDYQIHTAIEVPYRIDEVPFWEFSVESIGKETAEILENFEKNHFCPDTIFDRALKKQWKAQLRHLMFTRDLMNPDEASPENYPTGDPVKNEALLDLAYSLIINALENQPFSGKSEFCHEIRRALGFPQTHNDGLDFDLCEISTFARLELIYDTQFARSKAQLQRQDDIAQGTFELFPALELKRRGSRKHPRNWKTRWTEAGGKLYGERMIALVDDPIWAKISRWGNPLPPFDYNSGMGLEIVSLSEAQDLGLIKKTKVAKTTDKAKDDLEELKRLYGDV